MSRSPVRRPVAVLAALATIVASAVLLFAVAATHRGGGSTWVQADHALSDAVGAHVPAGLVQIAGTLTHLGDPLVLAAWCIVVAALLWSRGDRMLTGIWIAAVGGNALLNRLLKALFERGRPSYEDAISASGFSFPSGHTSGALVTYGMLAWLVCRLLPVRWHRPAVLAAVLIIAVTAASRVLLRVHFASDVVAGIASGSAWLALCIAAASFSMRYQRSQNGPRQVH